MKTGSTVEEVERKMFEDLPMELRQLSMRIVLRQAHAEILAIETEAAAAIAAKKRSDLSAVIDEVRQLQDDLRLACAKHAKAL